MLSLQIYFDNICTVVLTFVAKFSLITAATLTPTVHAVSVYAMNSTSTGLAAIAAASGLVRDDCRRQICKVINLYLLIIIVSFMECIKVIQIAPLLCPLLQEDATTPPSHKQILGCMHLPREPQRLTQIAIKYE